jgi:hypothetical protein
MKRTPAFLAAILLASLAAPDATAAPMPICPDRIVLIQHQTS